MARPTDEEVDADLRRDLQATGRLPDWDARPEKRRRRHVARLAAGESRREEVEASLAGSPLLSRLWSGLTVTEQRVYLAYVDRARTAWGHRRALRNVRKLLESRPRPQR